MEASAEYPSVTTGEGYAVAHLDDLGDGAAGARGEGDERRTAVAGGIAARRGVEVACRESSRHHRLAVLRGAAGAEDVIVGVVEAHGAQELGHRKRGWMR